MSSSALTTVYNSKSGLGWAACAEGTFLPITAAFAHL
ncbi:hypothetical protein LEMLEM_LOCUS10162 [Lemmus lemmus]